MLECTSINADGLDLISDKYFFTLDGLFTNDNDVVMNDMYIDGQSYNRTKIQVKKLVLNGFVRTLNVKDFMYLRQILCTKKLKTFTVTIPYFETLTFQAEIVNWGIGPLGSFTISCQLVLPDPYIYEATINSISLGATANSGLTFPFTFPIVFGDITGASGTITNKGNAVLYPIFIIVGSCSNVSINNQTTGETISCGVSLGENDVLVIDNNPKTRCIKLNGILRMDLKVGNWVHCEPGDNIFVFTRDSLETKHHLSIEYQAVWI